MLKRTAVSLCPRIRQTERRVFFFQYLYVSLLEQRLIAVRWRVWDDHAVVFTLRSETLVKEDTVKHRACDLVRGIRHASLETCVKCLLPSGHRFVVGKYLIG